MNFGKFFTVATLGFSAAAALSTTAMASSSSIDGYALRAAVEFGWSAPEQATVPAAELETPVQETPNLETTPVPESTFDPAAFTSAIEDATASISTVESVSAALELFAAVGTEVDFLITVDPSLSKGWVSDMSGNVLEEFDLATGKGGLSSRYESSGTPTGAHIVYGGVRGEHQEILKWKSPTGRTASIDTGTAHVTTALLALRGLEDHNATSAGRNIYIHGTNYINSLGEGSQSGGCVRVSPEVAYTLLDYAREDGTTTGVYVLDRPWVSPEDTVSAE